MSETSTPSLPESQQCVDRKWWASALAFSLPTVDRMIARGDLPQPIRCGGRLLRWRMRTGDSRTGALDWLDARSEPVPSEGSLDGV
jgi:predicted DNA-binding transcriptional regulator AlpA